MKGFKKLAVFVLALLFCCFLGGCGEKLLDAPAGLVWGETYTLYWRTVTGARRYYVEVRSASGELVREEPTYKTYLSLQDLPEGNYEVRVRAVGGANYGDASPWSEVQYIERERESGLIYTLINSNTEYEVAKIGTASGEVEIKEKYRGKPVTSIAESAFSGKGGRNLTSVKIGPRVTRIGDGAFNNCSKLLSVEMPDSVTYLGEKAFQNCSLLQHVNIPAGISYLSPNLFAYCRALEEIVLPETITAIGENAFYGCSALKEADLPDALYYIAPYAFATDTALTRVSFGRGLETVDAYAFYNCLALETLEFSEEHIPFTIGDRAFEGCAALSEAVLPEGLVSLGGYAFYNSGLSEVSLPESVTEVGEFAFHGTALYAAQEESGFIFADDWLVALSAERKREIAEFGEDSLGGHPLTGIAAQTFLYRDEETRKTTGCPNLARIDLPVSLRYIGEYAFYASPNLARVQIDLAKSYALVKIGDRAFQNCYNLNALSLPEGLEEIGSYAFYGCMTLNNNALMPHYIVPRSVKRIGTQAFRDTALYRAAAAGDGVVYAGNWVVDYNNITTSEVTLRGAGSGTPSSQRTEGIADYAFYGCAELERAVGTENAEHIGRGAFSGCTSLASISLSPDLERVEDYTFNGCSQLFDIDLSNCENLTYIGVQAFNECSRLGSVDLLGTHVREIGAQAFKSCVNITRVAFDRYLETIGELAFYELKSLESVTFPDSVREIGDRAFASCKALSEVTFGEGLQRIGDYAFTFCGEIGSIALPAATETVGEYAFYKCEKLSALSLGSVKDIGTYAFACTAIPSLRLPATVRSVGVHAFKNCKELLSVLFEGTPAQMGSHAFFGCDYATFYFAAAREDTELWSGSWNSSFRPVFWSVTLKDGYVYSVTAGETTNPYAQWGLSAPFREGYGFLGWATEEGADRAFALDEIADIPPGTVLYAVYGQNGQEGDLA